MIHLRREVHRLEGELALAKARAEADRIACGARCGASSTKATAGDVPEPLSYALGACGVRAVVTIRVEDKEVVAVLGGLHGDDNSPDVVWAAVRQLTGEGPAA